jgi:hypothetical protein
MKNKVEDLRNHLFATLEALQDKDKPMEIERAQVIATVAREIIHSAKVENEFMKITGSKGSGFIPDTRPQLPTPSGEQPKITVHRLK